MIGGDPKPGKGETKEETWKSFDDFNLAIESLPLELGSILKAKRPSDFDRKPKTIEDEVDMFSAERLADTFGYALSNLYGIQGTIHSIWVKTKEGYEVARDAFYQEVAMQWERRKEEAPFPLEFSRANELNEVNEGIASYERELQKLNDEKTKLERKMSIMGPKKKERIRMRDYRPLERAIEVAQRDRVSAEWRRKRLMEDRKRELEIEKTLNASLLRLSGEQFWEAQSYALDVIFRFSSMSERSQEYLRKILDDALLNWALEHAEDPPMREQRSEQEKGEVKFSIERLSYSAKKLLDELRRIYPVVREMPNQVNLEHAQIVYRNLILRLPKK